jgi:hypothetical protein
MPKISRKPVTKKKTSKKSSTPKASTSDGYARPSGVDDLEALLLNYYGKPTSGKTMCALTASKDWPKNAWQRTKRDKWVTLEDVILIGFDRAAVVGLLPHKIRIKYFFNFPEMVRDLGFLEALVTVSDETHEIIDNDPKVAFVIHDTITTMDKYSLAYWSRPENCPVSERTRERDTRGMYGVHLETHRRYQTEMAAMPAHVTGIFLFHERAIAEEPKGTTPEKQAKKTSKQLGDALVAVTPYVTGAGLDFYTNDASLELYINFAKVPGRGTQKKRMLHPATHEGRRSKNRFEHLFTEPVPADTKLILNMVRDACK